MLCNVPDPAGSGSSSGGALEAAAGAAAVARCTQKGASVRLPYAAPRPLNLRSTGAKPAGRVGMRLHGAWVPLAPQALEAHGGVVQGTPPGKEPLAFWSSVYGFGLRCFRVWGFTSRGGNAAEAGGGDARACVRQLARDTAS